MYADSIPKAFKWVIESSALRYEREGDRSDITLVLSAGNGLNAFITRLQKVIRKVIEL
jgi:hypothetical protein